MNKIKKTGFIIVGILLAFLTSILIDRVAGVYLNRIGYFTALTPNLAEIHEAMEFSVTSKTSSQGLRDEEAILPKPKNTYRILAVGDSFTFGWGVEPDQSWVELLEPFLTIGDKRVEVVNGGKPGASQTVERRICLAYKDRLEIDAVIVGLYVNDFIQVIVREQELDERPLDRVLDELWPTLNRISHPVIGYSRFPNAKSGDIVRVADTEMKTARNILRRDPTLLFKINPKFRNDFLNGRIMPMGFLESSLLLFPLDKSNMDYALSIMDQRFSRIKSRCTKDLPVYIVFIPSAEMVSDFYFPFQEELGYTTNKALLKVNYDGPLQALAEKYGFYYFSPLSVFRELGCNDCYYLYDGHLTKQGHERLADFIGTNIKNILHFK